MNLFTAICISGSKTSSSYMILSLFVLHPTHWLRNVYIRNKIVNFIKDLEAKNIFTDKIVTEVNNIVSFFVAEEYHHDYFTKNPQNAYCQAVINPKLAKLRSSFSNLISE